MVDFNGGGKPDILTEDGFLNLGNGDRTFRTGTAVTGTPLAVADFNGDGKPDLLEQGTGTLLVLLGNGDGTFQAPISTNSGASLGSVVAGDVNGDDKPDILGVQQRPSLLNSPQLRFVCEDVGSGVEEGQNRPGHEIC